MNLYADNILDHYRHPRNTGRLSEPSATREEINTACGDHLTLDVRMSDGCIAEVRWEGQGCAISQAAMSILSEELSGMSSDAAMAISPQHVRDMLGVPVGTRRLKCAFLCLHALKNTLLAAKNNPAQSWEETLRENA